MKHRRLKEAVKKGEVSAVDAVLQLERIFLEQGLTKEQMYSTHTYKWLARRVKNEDSNHT